MNTNELCPLNPHDLAWCLRRAPKAVLQILKENPRRASIAGGFIRACIAKEPISDVDIFAANVGLAEVMARRLAEQGKKLGEQARRVIKTDNAYTICGYPIDPQIIHRWTFEDVMDVTPSFDFTIACAVIFWCDRLNRWQGFCHKDFYSDLAAKRLVYRAPTRNEDAGGSMLRVLKFYTKGYRIPLDSLGAVMARMVRELEPEKLKVGRASDAKLEEKQVAKVLTGMLREVDPNIDPTHIAHLPTLSETDLEEGNDTEAAI